MRTSPELLADILSVLGKINSNIESIKGPGERKGPISPEDKKTRAATRGLGIDLGEFAQDKSKIQNLKETTAAIKELSSALAPLSIGLIKFGLIPKSFKGSLVSFIHDLIYQSSFRGIKATVAAKQVAESMNIIGEALPKLAKGVFSFGIVTKLGLVTATSIGITTLMGAMASTAALAPVIIPAAAALAALGVALTGISNVLKSIALLVLSFAGAIVIMVGAIWLASTLFKVGPLAAMGIIVGSILILAAGFALIGLLSPLIAAGGIAVQQLGIGMALAGLGILTFIGSLTLANVITGNQENTNAALWSAAKSLALLSLVFAGIGIFGGLIQKGGIATQHMGKGMVWAAAGILAMGGVYAILTKLMKVDVDAMFGSMAKGLVILGLTFAGLGLFSPFILLGSLALTALAISLGMFALIMWGVTTIIDKKLGGTKGLKTVQENIELMVGGVLKGVIGGVSSALLGDASGKGFFAKVGTVAKNAAILIGSIFLLIGVSFALMIFAGSLRAFQKAGVMKDEKGKDINIVDSANNIANAISIFFKTLIDTFNDPKKLPDKTAVESMVDVLMGNHGYKKLGIKRDRSKPPRPGLIDALQKFGEIITMFAKTNQIPVYDIDEKGNVKQKTPVKPKDIAVNIVNALEAFFKEFKGREATLTQISTDTSYKFAEVLLGQDAFRLMGLKIGKDKHGLLEPILKFSQILTSFAKADSQGFPDEFDDKGNAKHWTKPSDIATRVVAGISDFMTAFSTAFASKGAAISGMSKGILRNMVDFEDVIKQLANFSKYLTDIDKLAITLGTLANNIGTLSTNIGAIDTDKLDKAMSSMKKAGVAMPTQPVPSLTGQPGAGTGITNIKLDPKAIEELTNAITTAMQNAKITNSINGTFKFEFMRQNEGNIILSQ